MTERREASPFGRTWLTTFLFSHDTPRRKGGMPTNHRSRPFAYRAFSCAIGITVTTHGTVPPQSAQVHLLRPAPPRSRIAPAKCRRRTPPPFARQTLPDDSKRKRRCARAPPPDSS